LNAARISIRGHLARTTPIYQQHRYPTSCQVSRAGDTDDPGTYHGYRRRG
jgi:hypothetical protein